jgi:hypothetical protein
MSVIVLFYSSLFVIIFIVSLIIFNVQFHLLTTCSVEAVSRFRFLIHAKNIGVSAEPSLSCLVLPSIFACRRTSNLFVIGI